MANILFRLKTDATMTTVTCHARTVIAVTAVIAVIASAAKQSRAAVPVTGLLRCARNDDEIAMTTEMTALARSVIFLVTL